VAAHRRGQSKVGAGEVGRAHGERHEENWQQGCRRSTVVGFFLFRIWFFIFLIILQNYKTL
jgi:hypothetical protein